MATFPTLTSGRVALKYPLKRTVKQRSEVLIAVDRTEQRFAKGLQLYDFELSCSRLSTVDKNTVRDFFNARRGSLDTSWDLVINDPSATTYSNLQFVPDQLFDATQDSFDKWTFTLSVRQTR